MDQIQNQTKMLPYGYPKIFLQIQPAQWKNERLHVGVSLWFEYNNSDLSTIYLNGIGFDQQMCRKSTGRVTLKKFPPKYLQYPSTISYHPFGRVSIPCCYIFETGF